MRILNGQLVNTFVLNEHLLGSEKTWCRTRTHRLPAATGVNNNNNKSPAASAFPAAASKGLKTDKKKKMSSSESSLWDLVVDQGLAKYETKSSQANYTTLVIIGAPKSVIIRL